MTLEQTISDLWRQHPTWPATYSQCATPACHRQARGGHRCKTCILTLLEQQTEPQLARTLDDAITAVRKAEWAIYDHQNS